MNIACIAPLFVPADRPDRYSKASKSGADAIIIDLEDAVASSAKAAARIALATVNALPTNVPVIVRLNGRNTPWYSHDLSCIASLPVAGVMLPKTEKAEDISALREALGPRAIFAMIESARGLAAARDIASATQNLRLVFGSFDFSESVGCEHTRDALLAARSEIVLASALGGLLGPIDGVTTALDDDLMVETDARHAAELGFAGKLCIHPRQIRGVLQGFAPTVAEIAWARRVMSEDKEGAFVVDGTMVDAPVKARARRVLRLSNNESRDP